MKDLRMSTDPQEKLNNNMQSIGGIMFGKSNNEPPQRHQKANKGYLPRPVNPFSFSFHLQSILSTTT